MRDRTALLIVDVQNDFCPGGALPVPDAARVLRPLNRYLAMARARHWPVYASRDWHPASSRHFQPFGGPWPPHCVQHTEGAAFHRRLRLPPHTIVITKGADPDDHGYSAFEGTTPDGRSFLEDLRARGVGHLCVGGLATDYCVKRSALDALRHGVRVTLLVDAMAGLDARPGDADRAIEEVRAAGGGVACLPPGHALCR